MGAVLCITANLGADWRLWVIFVGGNRGRGLVYVRSTSDRVAILRTAAKDAKCQERHWCAAATGRLLDHLVS